MANINVNPDVTDQFYRYKMPRLIAKVEGKGNGIKTVIPNMAEIAKSLSRPPTYPTKFFGCELGAQTQFDTKNERYIVNGSHDAAKLQELLSGFIKKFVLCPECDNPETNLVVLAKRGIITQRCIACGHQCNMDMRHKLTTYILKNPPDMELGLGQTATPAKKEKYKGKGKRNKDEKAVNGSSTSPKGSTTDDDVIKVSDKKDEDDVDWGEDISDAAVEKRMAELSNAAQKLAVSDELEKTQQERLDLLYAFVKERRDTYQVTGVEKEKEIVAKAELLEIKDKGTMILLELLCDENIITQITQYRNLFLRFTNENLKAQRYLIGGLEQLVGKVHKDTLLPKIPHIFKKFYDADILDEEALLEWGRKGPSKKYVDKEVSKEIHAKAQPFLTWLAVAEAESEDESEEDDVEVVYSHTEKVGTHTVVTEKQEDKKDEEEDDDFDIDAI